MIGNKGIMQEAWLNVWSSVKNSLGIEFFANRDASDGYPSLSGFALKLKNAAGTITSTLSHNHSAARVITIQDRNHTIAGVDDIASGYNEVVENYNIFHTRRQKDSITTNILLGKGDLIDYKVDGISRPCFGLTNSNFEQSNVSTGFATSIHSFNFVNKGLKPSHGVLYSYGRFFLNFYYTWRAETVTARVKDKNNIWYTANVISYSYSSYYIDIPLGNYLVEVEFTLTGCASNTYWALAQIQYHPDRFDTGLADAGVFSSAVGTFGGTYTFLPSAKLNGLPIYDTNALALAGGVLPGGPYRTSIGQLMVAY